MRHEYTTGRHSVKFWLNDADFGTMEQAMHLGHLPFIFSHIAIMPDAHQGYGMPIGGVMASREAVVPNAVGVDIGCGVCAVKTSIPAAALTKETLRKILGAIKTYIPVGFSQNHRFAVHPPPCPDHYELSTDSVVIQEFDSARKQIGTLGGGNHFIEIQQCREGWVWLMVHSGSRNLGFRVARHHNDVAVSLNAKWYSSVPKEWELAFLPLGTLEARNYLQEMQYCVDFARENRRAILTDVQRCIADFVQDVSYGDIIDVAHNYAAMELHYETNVMVHRKGATKAYLGQLGVIPGSQGAMSYIVRGRGEPQSFMSCSHGAGRKMSREMARKKLSLEDEIAHLDALGVVHDIRSVSSLDEAAGAYKDISVVMANQADLVDIEEELRPLATVKG